MRFNSQRKIFFLILYEMGMDDKAVRRIMGITQEAIRSFFGSRSSSPSLIFFFFIHFCFVFVIVIHCVG